MGLIFAVPGHIEKIKSGEKTQTRRAWDVHMDMHDDPHTGERRVTTIDGRLKWRVGGRYAVIPKRGKKGVGWIVITGMWLERVIAVEHREISGLQMAGSVRRRMVISASDAQAEGGYSPEEYEVLWDTMYRNMDWRVVIQFKWVGEKR